MKLTKKIIQLEDGEVGIQFEPEELEKLGWKEGDEFEWIPTKEGYKLMKVNTGITVEAELDDKALDVGSFIQQLSEFQDQKFEALWKECKEKGWIKGMEEDNAKDWLFDYIFNGNEKDCLGFRKSFSEYIGAEWE